jgi:NAD(P)-dependent dehydrogenase (short-subunit alcohol dehydrogenase family)
MGDLPLLDRTAVVTGISGNLGPVWGEALCAAGARVVGIDRADPPAAVPPRLAPYEDRVRYERADVTVRTDLDAVAERVGAADVLVCSAGIDQPPRAGASSAAIEDVQLDDFRLTLDVNLAGTFNAIQVFGSAMARSGRGSIVTIGSLYASIAPEPAFYSHLDGFLKPPAYGASKAGVVSVTRYFARLWGPRGVRVNTLSPGGVAGGQDPEFVRKYVARVPLRRLAEPGDLGGPLVFLASDASAYLTGHDLRLDGGFTA